jgi:hypothetical protein
VAHYLKLCSLGAVDSPIYSEEDEKRALLLSTATNINLPIKSPSRSLFRIVVLRTSQSPSLYPLRYSRTTSLASPPPLSLSFAYFQNKTRSSNEKRNRVLTLHCIYPAASRSIPLPSRFFWSVRSRRANNVLLIKNVETTLFYSLPLLSSQENTRHTRGESLRTALNIPQVFYPQCGWALLLIVFFFFSFLTTFGKLLRISLYKNKAADTVN